MQEYVHSKLDEDLPIAASYPEDLLDPTAQEFDPARRRRKWLFDPARRSHRKGRMPAGLRRYWASKRKGKAASYHPRHRRGRRHKFDPARRRHFGRRHRRYDPAFGGATGGYMDIATDYGGVALGSIIHNFIVHTKGMLSKQVGAGPVQVTQLGGLAFIVGLLAERFGYIKQNGFLSQILHGIFGESFNVPAVESTQRTTTGGGGMYGPLPPGPTTMPQLWSQGYMGTGAQITAGSVATPLSGPYYTPAWYGF